MTESEAIKKAIRHFECMKNDAVVVLDSGFGTHPGESDLVYRNRKMYAELAINALEKQMPKKPVNYDKHYYKCPCCNEDLEIDDDTLFVYDEEPPKFCIKCGQKINWNDEE